MSWDNLKPPAPTDGWGTPPPKQEPKVIDQTDWSVTVDHGIMTCEQINNCWGEIIKLQNDNPVPVNVQVAITSDWLSNTQPNLNEQLNDALWTANALDSAVTKAGVVNALAGTKDEFNIDQDGELTRMKEIVSSTQPGPHGYYVAYHNGRWLHAILSGPYDTQADAYLRADAAYDKMINDAAFKLAFENKFERAGIYCAQIPLSAKRKGAYGVIDE